MRKIVLFLSFAMILAFMVPAAIVAQTTDSEQFDPEEYFASYGSHTPEPPTFYATRSALESSEMHILDTLSREERQIIEESYDPPAIGVIRDLNAPVYFNLDEITVPKSGEISQFGGRISRVSEELLVYTSLFQSKKADEIRLFFAEGNFPHGVKVNLFSKDDYAFNQHDLRATLDEYGFYTTTTFADYLTLQVVIPILQIEENVYFKITKVIHADNRYIPEETYRDCFLDANCGDANSFAHIDGFRRATARLSFPVLNKYGLCTGTQLNDTRAGDWQPFLLTANHCFDTQTSAAGLEARFYYWSTSCNSGAVNPSHIIINGSNLIATNTQTDFTLVLLKELGGNFYMGWDAGSVSNNTVMHSVHHPGGTLMKYHRMLNKTSPNFSCPHAPAEFHYTKVTMGQSEGGSSGSGVVDPAGRIRGQLFGACHLDDWDNCDYDTYYNSWGKFGLSYSNNNLQYWLNSGGSSVAISTSPGSSYNYGTENVGSYDNHVFTVNNSGSRPNYLNLEVASSYINGTDASQFSVIGVSSQYLAPGESGTFTVRFSPTSSGKKTAILNIPHNADNYGSPKQITLTGYGNPCSDIISLGGGGSQNTKTFSKSGTGAWTSDFCGYDCNGNEQVYSFVAPKTGTYSLTVTSTNSTWVDYFWKTGSCSSGSWTCINDIYSPSTQGILNWTAGTTYYILLDAEQTALATHSFYVSLNPCSNIISIAGTGSGNAKTYAGGGYGSWNTASASACGYWCEGQEQIYSFVAPQTGNYAIQVTAGGSWVDYMWKSGPCSADDWQCIDDVYNPGLYGELYWTAGETYLLLLDDEDNTASNHTFHIELTEGLGTWTGAVSTNWHAAGNWSFNNIPTSGMDVSIPNGVPHQPSIISANAVCNNLFIDDESTLTFGARSLTANGNVDCEGTVILNQEDAVLTVLGDIYWYSGSYFEANHSSTFINVYGIWEAQNGSNLNPEMGFVDFKGDSDAYIRTYDSDNKFYNLRIYKTGGAYLGLSTYSTEPLRVQNLIFVSSGAIFNNYDSEDIILEGAFNFYGTFDMTFNSNASSFIFDGVNSGLNNYSSGSGIFNNVVFSASSQAVAYTDFQVAKNLTIEQGTFNANGHAVSLAGDWTNTVGPDGFNETDSRVIFNGTGHQYVYGDEHFNILEVNNGAAIRLNSLSYDVSCNSYDWTSGGIDIVAGNFTAYDLADSGLWGTWWCNPNGTITLTQDDGQYVDLNGEIHIYGGTMTVNGGLGASYWPYLTDCVVQMTGGVLDFPDSPIRIHNSTNNLTIDITGGTIKTKWSFWDYRGDFTPEGGTLELYGSGDAQLNLTDGSNLYNLTINKQPADIGNQPDKAFFEFRDGSKTPINRANTVTASDTLVIANNFNLNAGTFTGPDLIVFGGEDGGDWNNNVGPDAFVEGDGTVQVVGEFMQYISTENFNILEMNKPNGDFTVRYDDNVECQTLSWISTDGEIYVMEGAFTAWDLFDSGIEGQYFLNNENSVVNLYQDSGQWTDLNAFIRIDNGTFNVFGGSGASFWPYTSDATLIMIDGSLNFMDNGIYLNGNSTHDLSINITGGSIKTEGSFTGFGDDFQPAGGNCTLIGDADINVGIDGDGYFHNLIIDKETPAKNSNTYQAKPSKGQVNAPEREQPSAPDGRANSASAWSNFSVSNDLIIENGTFDANGFQVTVNSDVQIYGTLAMTDSASDLTADFIEWFAGSEDNVTAGTFHATDWRFNEGTNAMIGSGNTAYVNTLYYCLDEDAEFGNLVGVPNSKLIDDPENRAYYPTRVSGDFTLQNGAIWSFSQPDAGVIVDGDASIEEDASISFSNNDFIVDGNINIAGTLNVSNDAVATVHGEITWPETGEVNINSNGAVIFDAPNHFKGWENINGHLTLTEGLFEITNNSIRFSATATTDVSGGTMKTAGAFYAIDPNVFEPTGGTVVIFGGLPDVNVFIDGGNFFYNLLIDREPAAYTDLEDATAITIKNDLTILNGILDTKNADLLVGGNWTNNVGPDGFVENENTVWFYGETYSHIYTDETFYDLIIFDYLTDQKPGAGGKIVDETYIEDGVSVNVLNNCRFLGGSLNMGSNSVLDVDNDFIFNGGQLIVPDGIPAEIYLGGHYTNFNPGQAFFPGLSTFTFDGIADQEISTDYLTVYFNNLNIDNPGNLVKFYLNTHVSGDVHVINGTYVNDGIFDHINTFEGDINVEPNGGFLPKGIINFEGNQNTVFNDQSTITSYLWGDVYVDKAADNLELVIADDMIILNGHSIDVLTGIVDLNGNTLRCTENVTIHDGGKITVDAGAQLEVGDNAALGVQDGGILEVIGQAGNPATLTAWNAVIGHRYFCDILSGGTISAEHAIFEFMKSFRGVNVHLGGIVDPTYSFNHCTFRNGDNELNSALLTINNDQVLTITGAAFPNATMQYNVAKEDNTGHLTFVDFSGVFSGEDYDYDPFNLIDWFEATLEVNPSVQNVAASAGSTTFEITSNLDWTASESTPWFSISPISGSNNGMITVNYQQNSSTSPRSGQIIISADGVPDVVATVNQSGKEVNLVVSPANRDVSPEAGTTTFTITSNLAWTVNESATWFDVSPSSGSNNGVITVTYDENLLGLERQGYITVSALVGMPFQNVTVTQASHPVHNINVPEGWSGLSSYLMPANNAIDQVFEPISFDFVIATTMDEVYYPAGPINTIVNWDSQSAYKIKMDMETTLPIIGNEESNKTFNLNAGWNLVPVICNAAVDAEGLFVGQDLGLVKDVAGFGILWPEYNINTIGVLVPGRAYYAMMNSAGFITYPANVKDAGGFIKTKALVPDTPWNVNLSGPSTHVIAISKNMSGILEGDLLGIVDEAGNCYGITEIKSLEENTAITVYADDPYSEFVDGFENGSQMHLKIYRPENQELINVEAVYDTRKPNTHYFAIEGISAITELKAISLGIHNISTSSISLYPNPTNGRVEISGIKDLTKIEIFNTNGKLMRIVSVENQDQHKLDLSDLPSGVYQLKFTGNSIIAVKKLIRN